MRIPGTHTKGLCAGIGIRLALQPLEKIAARGLSDSRTSSLQTLGKETPEVPP